jgi:hypothetical protein
MCSKCIFASYKPQSCAVHTSFSLVHSRVSVKASIIPKYRLVIYWFNRFVILRKKEKWFIYTVAHVLHIRSDWNDVWCVFCVVAYYLLITEWCVSVWCPVCAVFSCFCFPQDPAEERIYKQKWAEVPFGMVSWTTISPDTAYVVVLWSWRPFVCSIM